MQLCAALTWSGKRAGSHLNHSNNVMTRYLIYAPPLREKPFTTEPERWIDAGDVVKGFFFVIPQAADYDENQPM